MSDIACAPAPAAPDTPDLRQISALLRRQARLIVLSLVICLGLAALYLLATPPRYSATALIYVDPAPTNLLEPQGDTPGTRASESRLESEVGILRSDAVALAAIDRIGLLRQPEFGPATGLGAQLRARLGMTPTAPTGPQLLAQALDRYHDRVEIRRRGLTYLIEVTAASHAPALAAEIANGVAETHIARQLATRVAAAQEASALLEGQIDAARQRLRDSEAALDGFIDSHLARIEAEGGAELAGLRRQIGAAETRARTLTTQVSALEGALASADPAALAQTLQSEALQVLAEDRAAMLRRMQAAPEPAPPPDLRAALADIEQRMEAQAQTDLGALRREQAALQTRTDSLRLALRQAALEADLPADVLTDLYQIRQEAGIAQRHYATILARARDLRAQALVQVADSRVVSPALEPASPAFPDTRLVLALAALVGLGAGVGLGMLRDALLGGVTSPAALAAVMQADAVATVPRVRLTRGQRSPADIVLDGPMTAYAEALRQLRASTDQALRRGGDHGRLIALTSTIPAEGKTSTALALARSYDQAGYKTLLIDADLRNPRVHDHLGLEPETGLADFLRARQSGEAAVPPEFYHRDPRGGAGAFLGRARSTRPTDQLLQSRAFEALLAQARREFDVVVIDTAPVLPAVDARVVLPHADAVLYCVSYDRVQKPDLREGLRRIAGSLRGDCALIGVLSGDAAAQAGYGYYGYAE